MTTIVQYSPQSDIAPLFHTIPFAYSLEGQNGLVLTTINRVRKYMAVVFGITKISKNLIKAIIEDVQGILAGEAIDTNGNIAQICAFHVGEFQRRVLVALQNGEIKTS